MRKSKLLAALSMHLKRCSKQREKGRQNKEEVNERTERNEKELGKVTERKALKKYRIT
jgi:hypothetical protein